jgi:hypothetical protein
LFTLFPLFNRLLSYAFELMTGQKLKILNYQLFGLVRNESFHDEDGRPERQEVSLHADARFGGRVLQVSYSPQFSS